MTIHAEAMALVEKGSVADLDRRLDHRQIDAQTLLCRTLNKIEAMQTQSGCTFTRTYEDTARMEAICADKQRLEGNKISPLTGIPVSVKDLCDVRGDITRAGSTVLSQAPPASRDSVVVQRLRNAGAIIVGKTNMTEFAFTNTGVNITFGTPDNPAAPGCLPGGSSSGAGVSVADGSVPIALGSDTGGSIRQPAALCGVCGFKPSEGRIPTSGVVPLSRTFDTLGPLARSVDCCAIADAALADTPYVPLPTLPVEGLLLGLPTTMVTESLDEGVADAFLRAIDHLSKAGARIVDFAWPELDLPEWRGSFGAIIHAEAFAWHRALLEERESTYDPIVLRILSDCPDITYWEYEEARETRERLVPVAYDRTIAFHAIVMPSVAILPPPLRALEDPEQAELIEYLIGRNNEVANYFNFCACTIPCHAPDAPPVGFLVMGPSGTDRRTLAIAKAIESEFQS